MVPLQIPTNSCFYCFKVARTDSAHQSGFKVAVELDLLRRDPCAALPREQRALGERHGAAGRGRRGSGSHLSRVKPRFKGKHEKQIWPR